MNTIPQFLNTITPLIENYDGFIIDLWGVLHDGETPYTGAHQAMQALHQAGKKVILLSNAPRRSAIVETLLDTMDFKRSWYNVLLTSGEATRHWLLHENLLGNAYYYVGAPNDKHLLDGSNYHPVTTPQDANFCLLTGFDHFGDSIETKLPDIKASLHATLPLICANPDRKVVKQDGRVMLCAGILAEWYHANGGKVYWFGKPYPAVYQQCFAYFQQWGISKHKLVAIGDSLHTDIAGAKKQGIDSALVAGGILAEHLGIDTGELPSHEAMKLMCIHEGVTPEFVLSAFKI